MSVKNLLDVVRKGWPFLIAVAAPREAEAVLRGLGADAPLEIRPWTRVRVSKRAAVVLTGVGKANAAGAIARAIDAGDAGIVSLGVSGSLPGAGAGIGAIVVADCVVFADEGLVAPGGFTSIGDLGFPALEGVGERLATDAAWREALTPLADTVGGVATVSTCSGTDLAAAEIGRRTGAICEDMESAAAGLAAHRLGVPFACVRAVSNRTGNRADQAWDLARAFAALERVAAAL